jgi:uncharacterized protein (DUF1330 family)
MSAYVIATYNVIDKEVYREYIKKTMPIVSKYGGQTIIADSKNECAEGEPRNQVVVIKFESKEKAWGCINDSEYMEIKKLRHQATENGFLTLADEFVMQ